MIAKSVRELFSGSREPSSCSGERKNIMEPIAVWGDVQLADHVLTTKECWALRLGRVYSVEGPAGCSAPM
ncbi:MAG: hypothetical protein U0411_14530 [Thermodesulfovibrionales bacterium]